MFTRKSRDLRWSFALGMIVVALATLIITRGESAAPFVIAMVAGVLAYDG